MGMLLKPLYYPLFKIHVKASDDPACDAIIFKHYCMIKIIFFTKIVVIANCSDAIQQCMQLTLSMH